ncbi:uncharacterized protein LOC136087900 [Hydra vulgaris]|uniref:Uncharacterized protein LOC136087900 n=1 Tax=Hydra vulgaris TaxID=6087 RepID=A0ABM4D036_HYDVU
MLRSSLYKKFSVDKSDFSAQIYKKQRNLVVKLNRKNKKKYFEQINTLSTLNTSLWKLTKPFFSDKSTNSNERITLAENGNIISDSSLLTNIFNKYFINVALPSSMADHIKWSFSPCTSDPVESAIKKYVDHPSIRNIKNKFKMNAHNFKFHCISPDDITKIIGSVNEKKKTSGEIPTFMLTSYLIYFRDSLTDCINNSILDGTFPSFLKMADVLPCLKKNDPTDKANYRPISILPALSKVFEMIVYEQILLFMEPKFDKLLCDFRRGYSTQHTLIFLLNKWHECINNGGIVGILLMDLSKAYDFIPHDLLIAKLEAYGFSKESLKFLISYISGHTELCNFADDNTLYACDYSLEKVIFRLQKEATNTIAWFKFNSMVANPDKFQLLLVGLKNTKNQYLKISNITVFASDRVKLLGVTVDKNLNFGKHIKYLFSKANGSATLRCPRQQLASEHSVSGDSSSLPNKDR